MQLAHLPIYVSIPYSHNISFKIAMLPLPLNGLNSTRWQTSFGIPKNEKIGLVKFDINSKTPLTLSNSTQIKIATRFGKIVKHKSMLEYAPAVKEL